MKTFEYARALRAALIGVAINGVAAKVQGEARTAESKLVIKADK